jgi:hypothetical protein
MTMNKSNAILLASLLIGAGAARADEWEGLQLAPGVGLGVLVEVEAAYEQIGDEESTDASVATFEVGLEAEPMEGVRGEAALLGRGRLRFAGRGLPRSSNWAEPKRFR